jgi:hypothetical protein
MLAFNGTEGHLLNGAIDSDRIGLTGHSGGGFTTLFALYGGFGAHREDRIDAAVAISGSGCFYDKSDTAGITVPSMFIGGSEDLIVPRRGNRQAYDNAQPPRYWVEIHGASHVRFTLADIDDEAVVGGLPALLGDVDRDDGEPADAGDCIGNPDAAGNPPLTIEQQQRALKLYATPFLDAYLKDDPASMRFLRETLPTLPDASYEFEADSR